mmetsp:Transcript_46422/g.72681  ORF Transcript_46422/g.72681 Transcript_46422/m.72681 type:complete len:103 (-) Transcript_46422:297-605(-)
MTMLNRLRRLWPSELHTHNQLAGEGLRVRATTSLRMAGNYHDGLRSSGTEGVLPCRPAPRSMDGNKCNFQEEDRIWGNQSWNSPGTIGIIGGHDDACFFTQT